MPGNPVETRTRGSILARAVRARRCARELIGGRSVGGVASRVVGRSRTVVDAEYLEPPGLAGSPRGCVPVPGRANHRGEPRRSPRATPQPRPRSPPVPSREGRTRGVGGLSSRDAVRRCDGRGARRHRRRRRHRHRGRARGTPIRPCVSRARALSDARRVVEIQQRRGQSPGISVQKNPAANRKLGNLARCADLSNRSLAVFGNCRRRRFRRTTTTTTTSTERTRTGSSTTVPRTTAAEAATLPAATASMTGLATTTATTLTTRTSLMSCQG